MKRNNRKYAAITMTFQCSDERIKEIVEKFFLDNEKDMPGMSFYQFKDKVPHERITQYMGEIRKACEYVR